MRERYLYNKTMWATGPWQAEIDFASWIDRETGYPCHIRRNQYGAWCGFVGLDTEHPLYMTPSSDETWSFIDVHGSIGFCGFVNFADEEFVPPKKLWWVGFNCSHQGDMLPRDLSNDSRYGSGTYRDVTYVQEEVRRLAEQLAFIHSKKVEL